MAERIVIVGSGIAGLAAAESARARSGGAAICMVSEEPHPFYSRPGLAYLLRGDVPEKQLHIRTADDLGDLHLDRRHARVDALRSAEHEVSLSDGTRLPYDRLLLATGAVASPPPFPGGDLEGVVKLDGLDDARRILRIARRGKTAIVVGGGITALELVEGLHAQGMTVHYFLRGSRYLSDVLDETESAIVLDRLRHEGVVIHLDTQIEAAIGTKGRLDSVRTKEGGTMRCDLLAVAIGVKPRIDLARQAGIDVARGIVVNDYLETSAPDVFAAGDVAERLDPATGRGVLDVLWPTALEQGRVAGANMTGARQPFRKGVAFNVTQLAGLRVTIIGAVGGGVNHDLVAITRGESESWRQRAASWVVQDRHDVDRIRLMLGERSILGAIVMGDQTWSRRLQQLISEQVDVTEIQPGLRQGGSTALACLARFVQDRQRTPRR